MVQKKKSFVEFYFFEIMISIFNYSLRSNIGKYYSISIPFYMGPNTLPQKKNYAKVSP